MAKRIRRAARQNKSKRIARRSDDHMVRSFLRKRESRPESRPRAAISGSPLSRGRAEAILKIVPRAILEDLAAASRILVDQGVFDAAGHVSMRHPENLRHFLMSRSLAPQLVTATDIMEFDLDCVPIDPKGRNGFIERFLHGEIYKQRPDVNAIAHSHSASVIPFGLTNTPMRAMYHNAAFLAAGVPVFDIREKFGATDIVISTAAKGAALAQALGDKSVALLRAHGMVVVAESLPVAVFRAIFTEVSARVQLQATALSGAIAALDAEEGRLADVVNVNTVGRSWDLWKRRVMK